MATFRRTLERSWWRRLLETLELLQKVRCWPPLLLRRHRPHHHLLHHRLHRLRLHRLRQLPAEAANGAALFATLAEASVLRTDVSPAALASLPTVLDLQACRAARSSSPRSYGTTADGRPTCVMRSTRRSVAAPPPAQSIPFQRKQHSMLIFS